MTATVFKLKPLSKASRGSLVNLPGALRIMDGRSTEARLLRSTRDAPLEGVPHPISAQAASLAERAAFVYLRLLQLDHLAMKQRRGLTPAQSRLCSSLSTQHSRLVKDIAGLTGVLQPPGAPLDAYLAKYESGEGAAA
jgi:hypothetical protein